jgi:hypothetical protein
VTPLASDMLMLAPHVAAVGMAYRHRALLAGLLAGIAFWISPKGLFVLAACLVWYPAVTLAAAFAGAVLLGNLIVPAQYLVEIWIWGRLYAGSGFSFSNAVSRTLNWFGFHAAFLPALLAAETRSVKWLLWLAISLVGVAAGFRFFPRYYFQLLPVLVLLAARGYSKMPRARWAALLLLVPLIRFAPTYFQALHPDTWRDTAMDQDSRAAAAQLRTLAHSGDNLVVWGYRPEIYVYSKIPAATQFLESQPLTGVPADRHLTQSTPVESEQARANRLIVASSHAAFVVDGLGLYNPKLALTMYPELRTWLGAYREVGRTPQSIIYQRSAQ